MGGKIEIFKRVVHKIEEVARVLVILQFFAHQMHDRNQIARAAAPVLPGPIDLDRVFEGCRQTCVIRPKAARAVSRRKSRIVCSAYSAKAGEKQKQRGFRKPRNGLTASENYSH